MTALHWLNSAQHISDNHLSLIAQIQCDKQLKVNAVFLPHPKAHVSAVRQGRGHLRLDLLVHCEQLLALLRESGVAVLMISLVSLFKHLLREPKLFKLGELKRPQLFHGCGEEVLVQVVCLVVCNLAVSVPSIGWEQRHCGDAGVPSHDSWEAAGLDV